jgi:hypothetical protein
MIKKKKGWKRETNKMKTAMQNAKQERQTMEIFGYVSVSNTQLPDLRGLQNKATHILKTQ